MSAQLQQDGRGDLARLIATARGERPADLVLGGGRVMNIFNGRIEEADLAICDGVVAGLGQYQGRRRVELAGAYVLPGFIEGHLHVESSFLSPAELARAVCPRGTSMIVGDPHEIANVMGLEGVRAMLEGSRGLPVTYRYLASSCVPATGLETSGASLSAEDLLALAEEPEVLGLAEMMNYPGVLMADPAVLAKLAAFAGGIIDGHAPLLAGRDLNAYLAAGPESDHECSRLEEAAEKLAKGMWIMIRQGTSAQNLAELLPVVNQRTLRRCLLVSDDRHPDELAEAGHLDDLLRLAVAQGWDPVDAVTMVTLNPARRFGLKRRGALAPGYLADLVVVEDLADFEVRQVYQAGRLVAEAGRCLHPCDTPFPGTARGTMHLPRLTAESFQPAAAGSRVRVIELQPGQIITGRAAEEAPLAGGRLAADPGRDLALLAVVERHHGTGRVGVGLVRGLGLKRGALASSVAHDSHNLVVAGADPQSMLTACRHLAETGGGICAARDQEVLAGLALPLAGLMSDRRLESVLVDLRSLREAAAALCRHPEPFMAMSFLALPVIPHLKLTDQGLVDVDEFGFTDLWLD